MAAEPVEAIEENESKSKLPMILGALAVFVLGGGAGLGGSMFMGDAEDPEAAEAGTSGDGEDGEEGSSDGDRAVHDLGLFTVNLRGSGGGRILRMEVSLETTNAGLTAVQDREAQLRDTVITLVSDYDYADLEGLDGKTRLRDELLGRVNTLMPTESRVQRIYFTQFLVQ